MKDKELDQILQHALTPTVSDEEIKVNYEMEGRPMMKKDRKSTRLNSSHSGQSRMPSSA